MTPEEIVARLIYRDGLMLVIDKPAGLAVHQGPKGGESLEVFFGGPPPPPATTARARASSRSRHLGLPGARPPSQGAGRARPPVQERTSRQELLRGGGGGRAAGRRAHRAAPRATG